MANVDPFVIKWPSKWLNDQEIGPVIRYLNRFLHDLWQRSGGGNDIVIDLQDQIDAIIIRLDLIEADIVAIKARLDVLEALVFIQITASANHTTTRNEIITCTNTSAITISLNATPNTIPAANEECHITATDARVVLSGNGKLINGLSSITINAPNSRNVIYNSDADGWFIR